jgi:hypothetical protein
MTPNFFSMTGGDNADDHDEDDDDEARECKKQMKKLQEKMKKNKERLATPRVAEYEIALKALKKKFGIVDAHDAHDAFEAEVGHRSVRFCPSMSCCSL